MQIRDLPDAEVAISKELFAAILGRIQRLRLLEAHPGTEAKCEGCGQGITVGI